MFSFHKPKIYRSSFGCCICKAKSSSSRFTDSKKYEAEFEQCFRIKEKRSGEICNACVLLVKRWKKLSPENRSIKHWHHVVDARAGPGTKLNLNRRVINTSSSNQNNASNSSNNANASNNNNNHDNSSSSKPAKSSSSQHSNESSAKSEVSPLSLSHSGNQASSSSGGAASSASGSSSSYIASTSGYNNSNSGNGHLSAPNRRTNSFTKALAIDTNVSTFTFGEPRRRTYGESYNPYANTHLYTASSYANSSQSSNKFNPNCNSSFTKPQSALTSSAFESVLKRFRQRQQQQQLKAQRRQQQSQLKSQRQHNSSQQEKLSSSPISKPSLINKHNHEATTTKDTVNEFKEVENSQSSEAVVSACRSPSRAKTAKNKHYVNSDSNLITQSLDGFKVSTILDSNLWKRERTCCGIIFRGVNREIAIFPKLFKPCEHRTSKPSGAQLAPEEMDDVLGDEDGSSEPSPRKVKSDSVSSCESNTSGTGSMEPSNFETQVEQVAKVTRRDHQRRATSGRLESNRRQLANKQRAAQPLQEALNIPSNIATRIQRAKMTSSQAPALINSPSDCSSSSNGSMSSSSNEMLEFNCNENVVNQADFEDDEEGDEAEIVDDEDEDEEEEDEMMEGVAADAGSELGAGSSLMVDDESHDSTDAPSSVDSLVGQKAAVG